MIRFFASFFLILALSSVASSQYVIRDYQVDMELRRDGSMGVIERITTEFTIPRRGIFRKIPFQYDTGRVTRRVIIHLISVTDLQNQPQTTLETREGPYLNIRIGDEDVVHPAGTVKTYVIRYEVLGMMNWFEGATDWEPYAELYWNVIGDEWDATIERAMFSVRFPKVQSAESLRARVFAGPYGSKDSITQIGTGSTDVDRATQVSLNLTQDKLEGKRDAPLPPYTGISIVLNVPAVLISKPSGWQWFQLMILPNIGFMLPLVILGVLVVLWFIHGRDPHGGPIFVEYEPPDGLTPAEAGAMIDERVHSRDIAGAIVGLAVKGFLDVEFGPEQGLLVKRRPITLVPKEPDNPEKLSPFEDRLLRQIKKGGSKITEDDLRKHVATDLMTLSSKLFESLVKRGYYVKSPATVRTTWAIGGVVVVIVLAIFIAGTSPFGNPFPAIAGGIISGLMVLLFSKIMPRRTSKGAKALKRVQGFEEFIRRAESEELDWRSKLDPNEALFEKYLPYAIAFDLTRQWTGAFAGLLNQPPTWYHHPSGTFHYSVFSSDVNRVGTALASAAGTPPRSSGGSGGSSGFSSGGGFSGGGFGGGGGGSW
jgi:uncharacterized membrane protein YgcG